MTILVKTLSEIKKPVFKTWFIAYSCPKSIFILLVFSRQSVEHTITDFTETSIGYVNKFLANFELSMQNFSCAHHHQKVTFNIRRRRIIETHDHADSSPKTVALFTP